MEKGECLWPNGYRKSASAPKLMLAHTNGSPMIPPVRPSLKARILDAVFGTRDALAKRDGADPQPRWVSGVLGAAHLAWLVPVLLWGFGMRGWLWLPAERFSITGMMVLTAIGIVVLIADRGIDLLYKWKGGSGE